MTGLHVPTWLTAYLDACGRNAGKPPRRPEPGTIPALDSRYRRRARLVTAAPARLTPTTATTASPSRTRPRRQSACPHTGLPNTYSQMPDSASEEGRGTNSTCQAPGTLPLRKSYL
jgi:hypothetical protein